MKKELICIACPLGCRLTARWLKEEIIDITGNKCPRGEEYGKEEVIDPKRVVTATVRLKSASLKRLPVMTKGTVPKDKIAELLNRLYTIELSSPVLRGEVVMDMPDEGVQVLSSRTVRR